MVNDTHTRRRRIESFNATELLWTVELAALLCQGGSETALAVKLPWFVC